MFKPRKYEDRNFFMMRLTARVFAVVCLAIILFFIFNGGFDWSKVSAGELDGLFIFPVFLVFAFILAWWNELIGGAFAIGSVMGFYIIYGGLLQNSLERGWWFFIFLIPGALFLAYGLTSGQIAAVNKVENSKRAVLPDEGKFSLHTPKKELK